MMIHRYACGVCNTEWTQEKKFRHPHPDVCPSGHIGHVSKIFEIVDVVFRGSGFYSSADKRDRKKK